MRRFGISALLIGLIGGLFGFFVTPEACLACSCLPPGSPTEERDKYAAVFRGRVTAVSQEQTARGFRVQRVTFEVDRAWKGPVTSTMTVYTGAGGGDCGYNFQQGADYLVYASQSQSDEFLPANAFATGICSRTRPIAQAGDDLAALGPGNPPAPGSLPNLPSTGGGRMAAITTALTPALLTLGLVAGLLLGAGRLRRRA